MNEPYNPFTLKEKAILITGASSGIGKATALECSLMGAKVIITGRDETRLLQTLSSLNGEGHTCLVADITNEEELERLVADITNIDGAVFCAGIGKTMPVLFASRKKLDPIFNTNFFATIELMRLLLKKKKVSQSGSLVAIASIGGPFAINLGNGPYGAAKSALLTWTKFLAQEVAPRGIRVNCVCPGMVHTPLVDTPGAFSQEELDAYIKSIPLHRFGEAKEVADACVFFLSDASRWITGTELIIDGGTTLR